MSCSAPDGHSQQGTGPQCPEPQVEEKTAVGGMYWPPYLEVSDHSKELVPSVQSGRSMRSQP